MSEEFEDTFEVDTPTVDDAASSKRPKNLVDVTIINDYWPREKEAFIGKNAVPEGERIVLGVTVSMVQKIAFDLVNKGVVKLVVPSE
jgi:hypothetical protein